MKRVHFVPNRCIGCEECVVACEKAHDWQSRAYVEIVDGYFPIPMRCFHCEDAPCKAACPTGAIHRNELGAVVVDEEMCIGCGTCAEVCPFGVPHLSPSTGKIIKCDLCSKRVAEGEDPVCVVACPKMALEFVEVDDPLASKRQRMARHLKEAVSQESSPR
ncbi:MAG: 4Fe-4S dicluster domain-containing protein [Phycisphaerae bacterium]|nr:4Fe-4S dicluster domain-containing protein [Phycisphaerae bacterium]